MSETRYKISVASIRPDPPDSCYPTIVQMFDCSVEDIGHSDNVLMLKSAELDSEIAALRASLAAVTAERDAARAALQDAIYAVEAGRLGSCGFGMVRAPHIGVDQIERWKLALSPPPAAGEGGGTC